MVIYVRNFKAVWDAWEFCHEIKSNKSLMARPMIVEKKRKGVVKSIKVIVKLKK